MWKMCLCRTESLSRIELFDFLCHLIAPSFPQSLSHQRSSIYDKAFLRIRHCLRCLTPSANIFVGDLTVIGFHPPTKGHKLVANDFPKAKLMTQQNWRERIRFPWNRKHLPKIPHLRSHKSFSTREKMERCPLGFKFQQENYFLMTFELEICWQINVQLTNVACNLNWVQWNSILRYLLKLIRRRSIDGVKMIQFGRDKK